MIALLKATIEGGGRVERSSADLALVVIVAGRWNCSRMCSMSTSEHLETLSSATSVAEGSGGLGARVLSAVGDCGGRASPAAADREPATVAADPVGFPVADADGGSGAAMVVFAFLFALLRTAGGGGEDTTAGAAEPVSSPVQEECGVECDILLALRNAKNSSKLPTRERTERRKSSAKANSENVPVLVRKNLQTPKNSQSCRTTKNVKFFAKSFGFVSF